MVYAKGIDKTKLCMWPRHKLNNHFYQHFMSCKLACTLSKTFIGKLTLFHWYR